MQAPLSLLRRRAQRTWHSIELHRGWWDSIALHRGWRDGSRAIHVRPGSLGLECCDEFLGVRHGQPHGVGLDFMMTPHLRIFVISLTGD